MKAVAFNRLDHSVVVINFPPVRIDARLVPHTFFARQPPALQFNPNSGQMLLAILPLSSEPALPTLRLQGSGPDVELFSPLADLWFTQSSLFMLSASSLVDPLFHISPVLARAEVKFNNPPFIVVANSDRDQRLVVSGSKAKKHTLSQDGEKLRALSEVEGRCVFIVNQAGVIERKLKLNRFGAAASRRGATSERREEQKRQAEMLAKRDPVALSKATQKKQPGGGKKSRADTAPFDLDAVPKSPPNKKRRTELARELQERKTKTELLIDETVLLRSELRMKEIERMVPTTRWNIDKAKADLRDLRMALITTKECGIKLIGEDKTLVREAGERILIAATKQEKTKKNDPNTEMENAAAVEKNRIEQARVQLELGCLKAQEEEYEAWEREGERALPALQADLDSLLSEYNTLRLRIVQTKGQQHAAQNEFDGLHHTPFPSPADVSPVDVSILERDSGQIGEHF
ncbi:hypothetical protein BLNAU_15659 [Blattamonas nauphoetae]|uniref:Uncharacterized protein n=1 Tax=Blattamonas nauphoetae TaxID=2049346 RepID=A0ABQ9XAA7_9EUKA|nr:hypothetical protein BLNAU_15659 [Blattamonas nauphoetae]